MIKIITLANLQLFLTKCKTIFALKKHTHTAADITGLPSGEKPTTLYGDSADAGGLYPVFKGGSKNASLFDWMGNLLMRTRNPDNGSGLEVYYGDGDSVNGSTPSTKAIVVNKSKGVSVLAPDGSEVINAKESEVNVKDINGNSRLKITPTNASVKYSGKGLDVSADKTSLSSDKEVRLESKAGSGASLRLSEKDVHLDGIDGGMMVMCRPDGTNGISYSLNFPQKKNMSDTNDTNNDIESPAVKTFLSSIFGKTVSILGDTLIPNGTVFLQNNQIMGLGISIATDVNSETGISGHIFFGSMPTIGYPFETPLSVFTTPRMPSFSSLQSFIDETSGKLNVITIPDDEVSNIDSFTSLIVDDTKWSIFTNESGTQSWIAESKEKIYPLTYPVWETYTDFLSDGFAFISVNDNAEIRLFLCLSDNPENIGFPSLDNIGIGVERTLDVEKAIHLLLQLAESNGITI